MRTAITVSVSRFGSCPIIDFAARFHELIRFRSISGRISIVFHAHTKVESVQSSVGSDNYVLGNYGNRSKLQLRRMSRAKKIRRKFYKPVLISSAVGAHHVFRGHHQTLVGAACIFFHRPLDTLIIVHNLYICLCSLARPAAGAK